MNLKFCPVARNSDQAPYVSVEGEAPVQNYSFQVISALALSGAVAGAAFGFVLGSALTAGKITDLQARVGALEDLLRDDSLVADDRFESALR